MSYYLKLKGPFKPYVRMTQRGKFVRPNARAYLDSKMRMQLQLKREMDNRHPMLPGQTPLYVYILIGHSRGFHNRDLDNELKAILDAMQGIVFPDDRWVDEIQVQRIASQDDLVHIYVQEKADASSPNLVGPIPGTNIGAVP